MNVKQKEKVSSVTHHDTVSVQDYLKDLERIPQLSTEEQLNLLDEIHKGGKSGERARQKLVECNLGVVVSIAKQYREKNLELCDLISEGNIGLIYAIDKYDMSVGCTFVNYATYWIRRYIVHAIRDKEDLVPLPWTHQDLKEDFKVVSLDNFANDDGEITYGDTFADDTETDGNAMLVSKHADIKRILSKFLNADEVTIVLGLYGIGVEEHTLNELASKLHVSKKLILQKYERALRKLRRAGITRSVFQ